MKQLTIEQKAQRYDEAINAIKELKAKHPTALVIKDWIKENFPELVESEDEKIRKELISLFEDGIKGINHRYTGEDCERWIAWIKKQGEHKQDANIQINPSEYINDIGGNGCYLKNTVQEPIDKTKLKIEKGKWYVCISQFCNCIEGRAYKATSDSRIMDDFGTEYDMHSNAYKYFRLWTIQDARDGDLLASNCSIFIFSQEYIAGKPEAHCGIINGLFIVKPEGCWTNEKCYPATKEQRDLLFQKIKEAGYEWDADKKELKKIESYSLRSIIKDEPSPAIKKVVDSLTVWNKEDEKIEQAYNVETQKSVEWEPQAGDTFRKKGTTSPTYHLCSKREDGITFSFVENREVGIGGGEISIFALKRDYELVERLKPIEVVVEEEFNKALQTKGEQKAADKYKEWYDFIRWFVKQRTDDYTLIPSDDDIHKWGDNILNHARKVLEQKPAWSEEDEAALGDALWCCKQAASIAKDENDMGNVWYAENWLKSIKDRVQPQNTWKPSEEMLEALYKAIPQNVMAISEDEMLLDKLYQGLKYGRVLSKN